MASSTKTTLVLAIALAVISVAVAVSAQDIAPTPLPERGDTTEKAAGFSVVVPGTMIASCLIISLLALFKH